MGGLVEFGGGLRQRRRDAENLVFKIAGEQVERLALFRLGLGAGALALLLPFAKRDGVVAEHQDGARHGADLVAALEPFDAPVEAALGDLAHDGGNPLQRPRHRAMGQRHCQKDGEQRAADQHGR